MPTDSDEQTIAQLQARIRHLEEENKKWMRLAGTSRLTSLPNNLMFGQVILPRELRKGGAQPVRLACLLVCPDGVGEINQEYGRLIGDQLIAQFGAFLKQNLEDK